MTGQGKRISRLTKAQADKWARTISLHFKFLMRRTVIWGDVSRKSNWAVRLAGRRGFRKGGGRHRPQDRRAHAHLVEDRN